MIRRLWRRLWGWSQFEVARYVARRDGWFWEARAVPRSEGPRFGMDEPAVDVDGKPFRRTIRVDYMDEFESLPEEDTSDEELRVLVDALPEGPRHMVDRVFFGGSERRAAAAEFGVSIAVAERYLREGFAQLQEWIESGSKTPDTSRKPDPRTKRTRCGFRTRWGACAQPRAGGLSRCAAHEEWVREGITPDENYHRRVVLGEVTPIQVKLSPTEIAATMNGRYRGDGRRLDAYVTNEREES